MKRRTFIAALGGAAVAWPSLLRAISAAQARSSSTTVSAMGCLSPLLRHSDSRWLVSQRPKRELQCWLKCWLGCAKRKNSSNFNARRGQCV